jgi:hypothetical protein
MTSPSERFVFDPSAPKPGTAAADRGKKWSSDAPTRDMLERDSFVRHFSTMLPALQLEAFRCPPPHVSDEDLVDALKTLDFVRQARILKLLNKEKQRLVIRYLSKSHLAQLHTLMYDERKSVDHASMSHSGYGNASAGIDIGSTASGFTSSGSATTDNDTSVLPPLALSDQIALLTSPAARSTMGVAEKDLNPFVRIVKQMMHTFGDVDPPATDTAARLSIHIRIWGRELAVRMNSAYDPVAELKREFPIQAQQFSKFMQAKNINSVYANKPTAKDTNILLASAVALCENDEDDEHEHEHEDHNQNKTSKTKQTQSEEDLNSDDDDDVNKDDDYTQHPSNSQSDTCDKSAPASMIDSKFGMNDAPVPLKDEIVIPSLSLVLSARRRRAAQNEFTQHMTEKQYMRFCKCREAKFLGNGKQAFLQWLTVPDLKFKPPFLQLLCYIMRDRVGMIVEVALNLHSRRRMPQSQPILYTDLSRAISLVCDIDRSGSPAAATKVPVALLSPPGTMTHKRKSSALAPVVSSGINATGVLASTTPPCNRHKRLKS